MTDKQPAPRTTAKPDVATSALNVGRKRVATAERLIEALEDKFSDEEDDTGNIERAVDEAFETTVGMSILGPSRRMLKAILEGHEEAQDLVSGAVEKDEDPTVPITRK